MCIFERLRQRYIFNGSAIFYFPYYSFTQNCPVLKIKKGRLLISHYFNLQLNQIYNSSHVEEALKSLWDATTREEKIEEALIAKQSEVDKAIAAKQSQVDFWRCFKNVGSKDNKAKIDLLQSELKKLEKTHNETMEHLKVL